jgi:hypothetical protein
MMIYLISLTDEARCEIYGALLKWRLDDRKGKDRLNSIRGLNKPCERRIKVY